MTSMNQLSKQTLSCMLCIEPIATKRKCCNANYCDHCYTKNQKCPHCQSVTKQEKRSGATFVVKYYSEHEECRICLDPGLKRRCCNNYYCDECYYKVSLCRNCGTPVNKLEKDLNAKVDANMLTVVLGWLVTIFVILCVAALIAVVSASESQVPVGQYDFHCYGFFRTCNLEVCIDMPDGVQNGTKPLPPLSSWQYCTEDSLQKLRAIGCVFDQSLYQQSLQQFGYDICAKDFNQGIYIFEDEFDQWTNASFHSTTMKSARWNQIQDGFANDYCGAGEGTKALSFFGEKERFAVTSDLDVTSGGSLQSLLFLPPIGFDVTNPNCKTGYIGIVYVDYSTNRGQNWTNLASFDPKTRRSDKFFLINLPLPEESKTSATRFRFIQPIFEAARDAWAVDNVRVLRSLPKGWQETSGFLQSIETSQTALQDAQCCADTDWCQRRLSEADRGQCYEKYGWYDGASYLIRISEILLCITTLINLLKFLYISAMDYQMKGGKVPFAEEVTECLLVDAVYHRLPVRFRPKLSTSYNPMSNYEDFVREVHDSAREEEKLRDRLVDATGEGELKKRKQQIEKEERIEAKKLLKVKKKLEKRMKNKNFKLAVGFETLEGVQDFIASSNETAVQTDSHEGYDRVHPEEEDEQKDDRSVSPLRPRQPPRPSPGKGTPSNGVVPSYETQTAVFTTRAEWAEHEKSKVSTVEAPVFAASDGVLDDRDRLQRQNDQLLRTPFELDVDRTFLNAFGYSILIVNLALVIVLWSLSSPYNIKEPLLTYGNTSGHLYLYSALLIIFAMYCDFKEVIHTLKYVSPLRQGHVPRVTIDQSEEVKCLFIGQDTIPLADIVEHHPFTSQFIVWVVFGYAIGTFPWCILAMILREEYLDYSNMRIVTPVLGSIALVRAVLGPAFLIKGLFSLAYLFNTDYLVRDAMGSAFRTQRTKDASLATATGCIVVCLLVVSAVALDWLGVVVAVALAVGLIYGAFTGCMHSLAIRPWMVLTSVRSGVWLRVKPRRRCPCIYWGRGCSDLHSYDEVLVLFVKEEYKFLNMLKGGSLNYDGNV